MRLTGARHWPAAGMGLVAMLLFGAPICGAGGTPDGTPPPDHVHALLMQARSLLSDDAARSATCVLNEIRALQSDWNREDLPAAGSFLERPPGLSGSHATEHFRVHFSTTGGAAPHGWPDETFVLEAAAACERAWETYHRVQGWALPPADGEAGGDARIDVYLVDLGAGIFGYSLHEDLPRTFRKTGFIVIDNDFATVDDMSPLAAVRVTLAHEYHHLVQFGYGYRPGADWFMEQSATMQEAEVFPEIRDLYRYLPVLTANPHRRLDLCNGSFEYATWLWPHFLVERHGWQLVRRAWEDWGRGESSMLSVLDGVLAQAGSSLDEAFLEWATWNAFLGARDDGRHYARGGEYPGAPRPEFELQHYPVTVKPEPTRQPAALGANYIALRPTSGSADNRLRLELRAAETASGAMLIIWDAPGVVREIDAVPLTAGRATLEFARWSDAAEAWLVLANGTGAASSCDYVLQAETRFSTADVGEEEQSRSQRLELLASPNPFEPYTVVSFTLPEPAGVRLRIFDAEGRIVRTLFDGATTAGRHAVFWDGRDATGSRVLAGVFYGRIETPGGARMIPMVRVR